MERPMFPVEMPEYDEWAIMQAEARLQRLEQEIKQFTAAIETKRAQREASLAEHKRFEDHATEIKMVRAQSKLLLC